MYHTERLARTFAKVRGFSFPEGAAEFELRKLCAAGSGFMRIRKVRKSLRAARPETSVSALKSGALGSARLDISADHAQIFARSFKSFLGIVLRNESSVIVERQIPLAAEAIQDGQQNGLPLVNP
jgi:hypothetical protein